MIKNSHILSISSFANLWDSVEALRAAFLASGDFDYKKKLQELLDDFALAEKIAMKPSFYPHLLKEISTWPTATTEGQIDPSKFVEMNSKNYQRGIIQFCATDTRYITGTQYKEGKEYSKMVPLILAAHKKFRGIKYSEWMYKGLSKLVGPELYAAMDPKLPQYSLEEKMEARTEGLKIRSGTKAGTSRNPVTTYRLSALPKIIGEDNPSIGTMPILYQNMLTQIWCAHPVNRTNYTICSNTYWDSFPEPLIEVDLDTYTSPEKKKNESVRSIDTAVMPWD